MRIKSKKQRSQFFKFSEYIYDAAFLRFKLVLESFWKLLKKILAYEEIDSTTPRDVMSKAFQFYMIDDEKMWLKMLKDRNNNLHIYDYKYIEKVFENIKLYLPILEKTYNKLEKKYFG